MTSETRLLIEQIKAYSFPGGEDAARRIRSIKTTQRGQIRSAPDARWRPFTAEETVDCTRSAFVWVAQMGTGILSVQVTDAYENGHGRLLLKKGPLTLRELTGPDTDKGELQRYLAYVSYCPSMIVNNTSLEFSTTAPRTLRLRDRSDQTGAFVDIQVEDSGRIGIVKATRPMTVGKQIVMTPWSATASDFQEWQGLRVPHYLEASWEPPDGAFTYIQIEIITCAA